MIHFRDSLRRFHANESGIALVMALGIMLVFGVATVSVLSFTMSNSTAASNSNASQSAYNLADGGLMKEVAKLQDPANTSQLMVSTFLPTTPTTGRPSTWTGGDVYTYPEGTAQAWGKLTSVTAGGLSKGVWRVTATGTVSYAAGGRTQTITRKVSADVPVTWQRKQTLQTQAWHYIYSWNTGAQCDETVYNNTSVSASMYVKGNLCLQTPASIEGAGSSAPPVDLAVGGYVDLESNADIGKTKALHSVTIQGGCYNSFSSYSSGSGTGGNPLCGSPTYKIFPAAVKAPPPVIAQPVADFPGWYVFSSPGPLNDCDPVLSSPAPVAGVRPSDWPVFDDDASPLVAAPNNSLPTVVNITPQNVSYDCKTADGEIKWDAPTVNKAAGTLTINGTVYFDGSVTAGPTSGSMPIQYVGKGALYASGTFLLKNSTFCVALKQQGNTYSCDATLWGGQTDPDVLVIVANGVGTGGSDAQSQVATGDGIEIKGASFQGALYANHTIQIDTTSSAQAPMVSGSEIISQTGGSPFPILANVPFGTPGNPITQFTPGQPSFYRDG